MAGYSMGGKVARGAWVHLRARALYLEDPGGDALAFVACDLDQIPNGLSDRVAELLYKETSVKHLGREQIVLGGSHTHHGPGNFFSEGMYNSFATPRGGFDEELFEFLAHRIADAIAGAYAGAPIRCRSEAPDESAGRAGDPPRARAGPARCPAAGARRSGSWGYLSRRGACGSPRPGRTARRRGRGRRRRVASR